LAKIFERVGAAKKGKKGIFIKTGDKHTIATPFFELFSKINWWDLGNFRSNVVFSNPHRFKISNILTKLNLFLFRIICILFVQ